MARDQRKDKAQILKLLRETPIKEVASRQSGVSRATFYRWCDNDKSFAKDVKEAISRGRERVTDLAESQLIKLINQGKLDAIRFWLNNNDPKYSAYAQSRGKYDHDEVSEFEPIQVMDSIPGPED